ncbi:MAG: hypothetical protein JXQ27_04995 [Acidobacteria bacterium]|nr:hypothetical protein [Acidobacteriota bacterium]
MKRIFLTGWLLSSMMVVVFGATVVREISWPHLAKTGRLENGTVVADPDGPIWQIGQKSVEPAALGIFSINDPGITQLTWALVGEVRHEGVAGQGYLEMWNIFEKGEYYSRGLAAEGPLQGIAGDSGWRPFILPFYSQAEVGPLLRLELKLFLPAGGTVELRNVRLLEYAAGEQIFDPAAVHRLGGWLGAVFGGLLGLIGAWVGVLTGLGKARRLAVGGLWLMIVLGVVSLILALISLTQGYPWPVIYPLALVGLLGTGLGLAFRPVVRRRYDPLE